MPPTTQRKAMCRFGVFDLNLSTGELRKYGLRVKLQDQPAHVLMLLLEKPGEVVTREQIQSRLWPEGTYVDFDNAINSAVRKLRDALGDQAESPRFVETLSRRGYRFIAPVLRVPDERSIAGEAPRVSESPRAPISSSDGIGARPAPRSRRAALLATLGLTVVSLGAAGWIMNFRNEPSNADFKVTPLTTYPGAEIEPSFSPDGTRVAFAWNGPKQDNYDIYVKLIGPGGPVRLTGNPSEDRSPAWSPDGSWIAFLRQLSEFESAVMLVPSLGGAERELARVRINWVGMWTVPGRYLTWSADGKSVLTVDSPTFEGHPVYQVVAISVATGQMRAISSPTEGSLGDAALAVSPNTNILAFTRTISVHSRKLYTSALDGNLSAPRELTATIAGDPIGTACDLDWNPNGTELVFATCGDGIWRRPVSGSGKSIHLAGIGLRASNLSISRQGNRLVYSDGGEDENIWRVRIDNRQAGSPEALIASTKSETISDYSPDGSKIAFESDRSGVEEIWMCNRDGSSPVQLTTYGSGWSGTPRWSPDGKKIAFDRSDAGPWGIYVMDSNEGKPVRLIANQFMNSIPSWSADGKWIYFSSNRTGRVEIWKGRADGGSEIQVTRDGGDAAKESPDGELLYYKKGDELWRRPVRGGREEKVLEPVHDRNFSVTPHGIYFIDKLGAGAEVRFFDFRTGHQTRLASLFARCPGLAVSPDERSILFAQVDVVASDLMLVENFH